MAEDFDRGLLPLKRGFAYLPLKHAEGTGLQQPTVVMSEALSAQVVDDLQDRLSGFLDYAQAMLV